MAKRNESIEWRTTKVINDTNNPISISSESPASSSSKNPPGKRRLSNIVSNAPGPTADAKRHSEDELKTWELFFTEDILKLIVKHTNEAIDRLVSKLENVCHKDTYLKNTDVIEIRAFIGLLYIRGATKKNLMVVQNMFMHKSSPEIFQACMSYRRFNFLCSVVTFDDIST